MEAPHRGRGHKIGPSIDLADMGAGALLYKDSLYRRGERVISPLPFPDLATQRKATMVQPTRDEIA